MEVEEVFLFLRTIAGMVEKDQFDRLPLKDFTALALDADLSSPFLDALEQADVLGLLAGAERQALVSAAARTALWNQGYLDEMARICGALDRAGIEHIIVRGPVLVSRAYGDPLKRRFTDLDLLVRPEGADASLDVLRDLGYRGSHRTERDIQRRGWKGVVELVREGDTRSFDADLHTSLLNRRRLQAVFDLDKLDVWAARTAENLPGGGSVPALSLEDSLICAVAHLVLQHQMSDIRSLLDCVMLVRRMGAKFDWPLLFSRACKAGCGKLLLCLVTLIGDIIPLPDDEDLKKAVAHGRKLRDVYPLYRFFSIENCLPNLREKYSFAWRWVAERQSVFCMADQLQTAIRLALTESVPSAWRMRRLSSRRMSRVRRMVWSIPAAAILPLYIPVLMGHAVLARFFEPLIPARLQCGGLPLPPGRTVRR